MLTAGRQGGVLSACRGQPRMQGGTVSTGGLYSGGHGTGCGTSVLGHLWLGGERDRRMSWRAWVVASGDPQAGHGSRGDVGLGHL